MKITDRFLKKIIKEEITRIKENSITPSQKFFKSILWYINESYLAVNENFLNPPKDASAAFYDSAAEQLRKSTNSLIFHINGSYEDFKNENPNESETIKEKVKLMIRKLKFIADQCEFFNEYDDEEKKDRNLYIAEEVQSFIDSVEKETPNREIAIN